MIKRTVITTLIFLLGYALIIRFHDNRKNSDQYSEQRNIVRAERYLFYNTDSLKGVIVGSSLAERIISGSDLFDLGFGGYGAQDGLRIILMKKKLPPVVFVETNFSFNKVRMDFQQHFDKSFEYPEKEYIPMTMSQNQPVSFVLGLLRNRAKPKKVYDTSMNNTEHTALFSTMMVQQKKVFSHADTATMDISFKQLKMYIDAVKKRGAKVYFLQMPVNKALLNMPLSRVAYADYAKYFPDAKYVPIPDSLLSICKTDDGIHLNEYSGWMFGKYLEGYLHHLH